LVEGTQYPFAARTRSKAWISLQRKNVRFDANVIGMVTLGITMGIVFRDSRFFAALSLAHSTVATFCSYPRLLVFTDTDRFSKNGEVQTRHQNPPCVGSPCHRESELIVSGGNHQYSVRVARRECVG